MHDRIKRTLIKLKDVQDRTGLSKTTIYAHAALGNFPKPVSFGQGLSRWVEDEIDAWVNDRIRARDESAA
jgi:prophage regulatory protein